MEFMLLLTILSFIAAIGCVIVTYSLYRDKKMSSE